MEKDGYRQNTRRPPGTASPPRDAGLDEMGVDPADDIRQCGLRLRHATLLSISFPNILGPVCQ